MENFQGIEAKFHLDAQDVWQTQDAKRLKVPQNQVFYFNVRLMYIFELILSSQYIRGDLLCKRI